MKQKEIKVLMVEPGEHPKEVTILNDLDSLQKAVSIGSEHLRTPFREITSTGEIEQLFRLN